MSEFLTALRTRCALSPDSVAYCNSAGETITYSQLDQRSDALASWLLSLPDKQPVLLYGHKTPYMAVCMLACMKSGRAYVPCDITFPVSRVADILDQLEGCCVLDASNGGLALEAPQGVQVATLERIAHLCESMSVDERVTAGDSQVRGQDTVYIIFTSGSTGRPKGVCISSDGVDSFWRFMCDFPFGDGPQMFFNRVPFSFDVSITDFFCALTQGDTLFSLEERAESEVAATLEALRESDATVWTSTPSFVDICLSDPSFDSGLMPRLHTMILAGEALRPSLVRSLHERFPGLSVVNGYGPTETLDVITTIEITPDMLENDDPLPIGWVNPDSEMQVLDPETLEPLPPNTSGELYILGPTVATGYYRRPDLTEQAFSEAFFRDGRRTRRYKTGDAGYIDEQGLVFYESRLDSQIKLHGYRIELGEIEEQLACLDQVQAACVVPLVRDGQINSLCACVILRPGIEAKFATTRQLKTGLKEFLPEYMVPRKFSYYQEFPYTSSGKTDRRQLAADNGSEG